MAIYRLDVEKKYGQLQFRLYPQGDAAGAFGAPAPDIKALIAALDAALEPLDTKNKVDSVIFRNIEYGSKRDLREKVRFSKF